MPAYGGYSAQTSISASRSYTAEQPKSVWDQMLDRLSAAAKNPKNIGAVLGFVIGGPIYGLALAKPTSWAFDKMFGDPKTQSSAPAWGGMFSGRAISPERAMSEGSEAAYQSWQSKMQQRGIQQTPWTSYIASLAPKKGGAKQEEWGLLS